MTGPGPEALSTTTPQIVTDAMEMIGYVARSASTYRFVRIRFADEQSMALENTTVPADSLPSVDPAIDSLYDALGEGGPPACFSACARCCSRPNSASFSRSSVPPR